MKIFNSSSKKLAVSIIFGFALSCAMQSVAAESMDSDQGVRKSPSFQSIDTNKDHYVTKKELEGYPFLLKHFDKVDAGKNGQLEDHEYENLIMEKEREKGQ